jgi:gliding motility-associated-like protein
MKKIFTLFIAIIGFSIVSFSQTYTMSNSTVTACSGTFYDPGGTGTYANSQNVTMTFCSGNTDAIFLQFSQFVLESNFDYVYIYNGPSTASPLIGTYTGSTSPGTAVGTSGCITVRFTSDGSITYAGFTASISCGTPPPTPPPPSTNCNQAQPFCTGTSYSFPAATGSTSPAGPAYGCLGSQPNPVWYYLQVQNPGAINITAQGSNDIDFILWGPFASATAPCLTGLTAGTIVDCSFSGSATEYVDIPATAQAGQIYILLITNYANVSQNITFSQTGGIGTTNCQILCNITAMTGTPSACNNADNTYSVSGTISTYAPPTTGTLTISSSCGGSVVYNPPFAASYNYTLPGITANGGACTITASYSADPTCNRTVNYTSPAPCSVTCTSTPTNTGPYCDGSTIQLNSSGGDSYSWTGPNGFVSNLQNPTIPNATATNAGVYTLVTTLGTCTATSTTTVVVNSAPTLTATPTSETICSGQSTNISLTSNPVGASLSFSVNQSGVTGASAVNGTTIAQVLTATGATAGTATYTITPSIGTCIGSPISIPITVNPAPTVIATPTSESICSGQTTGINLTSNPAGSTFSWTVAQNNVSGTSAGNGSSINQTLTSNPGTSGTATYTVTPSSGTCPGIPLDVIINVGSNPTVTATPSSQSICSGLVTGIALSSTPAGATFAWTVSQNNATGATSGNGSSIAQTLTNSSTSVGSVTYTVTPSFGTCVGTPLDVVITVNPAPSVVATPTSQSICNGTSTGISLTSIPAGASFDWTVVQSNVNGGSAGTGSSINQSLSLSSGTTGSATYTITPSSSGCPGVPTDVVISVSAGPSVIASPETICSGGTSGVALSSNPAGASFNWTFNQTGVIGAFSGSGNSIAQTLNATTSNAGNVIYTVTANIGSCIGTPQDVVVTVNPSPVVTTTPSIQTICSGTPANIIFSSTPAGATFAWTVTQTGASGASAGAGNSVSGTYLATGPTVGTIVYDVVPTLNGCVGQPVSAVININPSPVVIATPASQTLCSGDQTNIALTSSPAGSSFSWTVAQNQVTGAFNGLGNTIAQTLSGTGTGTGTATYTVTPSASGCPGIPSDVVITIGSNPTVTATPTSEILCSGSTTGITLTSVPAGATFDWTINQTGVTGAVAGTGSAINQTLNTTGAAQGTVTYTITPSVGTCVGLPIDVTVTVNPIPTVTSNPTSQAICSSTSTAINLTSSPGGANLDWTTVETNATGSSAGNGSAIFQILSTTGTSSGTVTYTITPSMSGCVGTPIDVPVTVNPVPSATATPSVQTICSASAASIALSSLPVGATFAWTITESGTAGATAGNGSTINQTLSTTGTTQGTTFYTITPTLGTCVGSSITAMVSVNPVPVVTATPSVDALCSGSTTNVLLTSLPGTTFDWTVSQTGVSGASGGTGSSIAQTLTTLGQAVGTVTYTVTPTLNGCVGTPVDVVITVNPIPTAIATPTAQTICSGDVTGISLSSTPAGATFDWTFSQTGTTGAAAGNGNLIAQTIDATSTNSGSVTYTITPTFATCVGSPIDVVISIGSNPIATATPSVQTICEGTATSIALTSAPAGATYAWTVSQIGASGASAGNGSNIAQTLNAIGTVPGTVTYTITPNVGTCVGLPIDVVITVNPTPVVSSNPTSQAICSATSTNITLTSSPVGASLDWTVNEIGTSGATAGNGSTIAQTLDVTGLTSGTTTYTVTPTLSGCVGLPIDIVVTVNPTPVVSATPTTQTICSTTSPSIALSSTPTGAGFSWTVSESGTSGASAASGFTINQSLTATGLTQGTATYTISPTLGACIGSPIDVPIFVNPIPVVTATPASATICSGAATGITLSSSPVGATFDWTVVESNVSGASAGTGNGINQVLSSTSTAVGTATYTVTPTLNGCVGSPIDVVITVNPIPTAIATPASQTICSGDVTSIDLTSSPAGSTFGWTVNQSLASGATAGATSNIAQVLNATTSNTGTVTYNVTPTLNSCVGSPLAVVISVAANPVVTATPASQTICEGTSTGIVLSSSPTGATYNWTSSETDVTGSSAGTGASIAQVLDATALVPGTVTYTINSNIGACVGVPIDVIVTVNPLPTAISTPVSQTICATTATSINLSSSPVGSTFGWTVSESGTSGATAGSGSTIAQTLGVTGLVSGTTTYSVTPTLSGCSGSPLDVVITVDPTPTAIATPTTQTICSETAFSIDLTSSPVGSTFGWTVTELGETGANAGTGSTISETLTVTGITQGTATYTVTPTLGVCVGLPINVPIYVNPIPVVTALAAQDTICSATSTSITMSSVPVGASFDWTSVDNLVTGSSGGAGNGISQVLSSTSTAVGSSIYTITPTLTGCVGLPVDVEITVNPLPTVVATPSDETLCSGETSGIVLTSSPAGSTFNWTVLSANVLGAANGGGDTIAQTLTSTVTGTSTYSITPTLNGCVGPMSSVVVTVNPNPTLVTNIGQGTLCVGSSISMDVSGAVNYVWSPATGLDTNVGDSVVATPPATQTYFITGTDINNCTSVDSIAITVNPIPVTTVTLNDTICEGISINLDAHGADSYAWTPSTGLNSITDSSIVATPLVTTTYTVTGTSLNCSSTATVTVYVKPAPTINAGVDSLICYGNSIVLNGSGGVSYAWSGGVVNNVPFFPTATQTYTVVGTGANQCQDSDQVVVSITPLPIIDLVPSITSGCVPQVVDFQNNTIGASVYSWDFGDSTTSTMTNPSHNYTSIGCYDITLTASTLNGCTFTTTYPSMVCVELTPVASFFANPSSITTDYPVSTMVNTSQNAVAYSWDFGDGTGGSTDFMPEHTFPGTDVTTYTVELVVYSITGCTDTARVNIQVYEDIVYFVPNAFTPDGDNFNQTFKPVFTSGYDPYDYSLFIYDRWGEIIFESHDASVGWDGTYGDGSGIVMDGTYVWTIEFKVTQTSERKKIQGHVNVLR